MINSFDGPFRFLSNFYLSPVEFEGFFYPSVEHAYQAAKTLDLEARVYFQDHCITAGKAKQRGKNLTLRPDWETVKIRIMSELIAKKFQDEKLGEMLLATGDAELVEGNFWHDQIWGSCYCNEARFAKFGKKETCKVPGRNLLGQLLMETRRQLQLPE